MKNKKSLIIILMLFNSALLAKTPCDSVRIKLTMIQQVKIEKAVAKQLKYSSMDLLATFNIGKWYVFYVDTHQSDEVFLFYSNNFEKINYVNMWSGAAGQKEMQIVKDWAFNNVPGIPEKLASCFSWYATVGR